MQGQKRDFTDFLVRKSSLMAALEGIHPMTKVTGFLPIIFSKYGLIKLINNAFQNKINIIEIIGGADRVIIAVENSLAQHLHINS